LKQEKVSGDLDIVKVILVSILSIIGLTYT